MTCLDNAKPGSLWRFFKRTPKYHWSLYHELYFTEHIRSNFTSVSFMATVMFLGPIARRRGSKNVFYKVMTTDEFGACQTGWMHVIDVQRLIPYEVR